jgi:general secretion pathway protein H
MTINKKVKKGYTLIEILIIVLIISIIATFASLLFNRILHKRQAQMIAHDLATIITVAQQQAILQPATVGLLFSKHQYTFYAWTFNPHSKLYYWQPIQHDQIFKTYSIPNALAITIKSSLISQTSKENKIPQINFLSNGNMTAFTLYISEKNKAVNYELIGEENGSIQLKKIVHDK